MILVDSSVWIAHLAGRPTARALPGLLAANQVSSHPAVIGEIALGSIANRLRVLRLLGQLPPAMPVSDADVLDFLTAHRLWGMGIGWVDVHLLAVAQRSQQTLWTLDKPLIAAAVRVSVGVH